MHHALHTRTGIRGYRGVGDPFSQILTGPVVPPSFTGMSFLKIAGFIFVGGIVLRTFFAGVQGRRPAER